MKQLLSAVWLLALFSSVLPETSFGHALQPGYAAIEQSGEGLWRVFWRKPDVAGRPMPVELMLPDECQPRQGPEPSLAAGAWEAGWTVTCEGPLFGKEVRIEGLEATETDVLLRFAPLAQPAVALRLTADLPVIALPTETTWRAVLTTYGHLGFEHILEGWDHLLFLFALVVLIRDFRRLVGAVTAFTVAHSLTLAAATLGWVTLPSAPVEAVIALSIVFLASEIAQIDPERPRLSQTAPWLVTFAFGLLHGLGFAGALQEIGLPKADVPLALLAFNLGVELGQLAFVTLSAAVLFVLSTGLGSKPVLPRRPVILTLAYGIGGWASYWLIERIASFA